MPRVTILDLVLHGRAADSRLQLYTVILKIRYLRVKYRSQRERFWSCPLVERFGFFREGETVASLALALGLAKKSRETSRGSFRGFCVALLLRLSSPDVLDLRDVPAVL